MCNRFNFDINIDAKDTLLNIYVDSEFLFSNVRKTFYSHYLYYKKKEYHFTFIPITDHNSSQSYFGLFDCLRIIES